MGAEFLTRRAEQLIQENRAAEPDAEARISLGNVVFDSRLASPPKQQVYDHSVFEPGFDAADAQVEEASLDAQEAPFIDFIEEDEKPRLCLALNSVTLGGNILRLFKLRDRTP